MARLSTAAGDAAASPTDVYVAWAATVVLAYPCCGWCAALKARRADAWLSYL